MCCEMRIRATKMKNGSNGQSYTVECLSVSLTDNHLLVSCNSKHTRSTTLTYSTNRQFLCPLTKIHTLSLHWQIITLVRSRVCKSRERALARAKRVVTGERGPSRFSLAISFLTPRKQTMNKVTKYRTPV